MALYNASFTYISRQPLVGNDGLSDRIFECRISAEQKGKNPIKNTLENNRIAIAETLELDSILKIWDEYFIGLQ